MNRLAEATSPYLLQHKDNPVHWQQWGPDALAQARREEKPILLSIGYAACHWCHVMERESFEDQATADLMNGSFISIKVDREERPDIDSIYMAAVMRMTGHGGWPLTAFLTPEGVPFYAGTYYPPEPRHGMPAFTQVLRAVADAWAKDRAGVIDQAGKVAEAVAEALTPPPPAGDAGGRAAIDRAVAMIVSQHDDEWGGFGNAPKFPQPMIAEFLMRAASRGDREAHAALTTTLDRMARGGIFDHVGGGFARYSTDRLWLVPHFEKMLYDNAQLIRLYTRAALLTGSELYRRTALQTADYLVREMRHPQGGFFSSQDADSEGVEGRYYVWPFEELISLAGDDMPLAVAAFAASGDGNFEGSNVIWRPEPDDVVAERIGVDTGEFGTALERVYARLREAREARIKPGTDDKILAGWNGLAAGALAEAGRAFGREDLVAAAAAAAGFVLTEMRTGGRLQRSWRDGRTSGPGFLDDHSMLAEACLTLYETTFDPDWFERSLSLMAAVEDLFSDGGVLYDTGSDAESLMLRPRDLYDNAVPSGASVAAEVWLRLAALSGDDRLEERAMSVVRELAPLALRAPLGFGTALCAIDRAETPRMELALIGDLTSMAPLAEVAHRRYLPDLVIAAGPEGSHTPAVLAGRSQVGGAPAAYVCERFSCRAPVTDPADLGKLLVRS